MNATQLRNRIVDLTEDSTTEIDNVYKESLRAFLHLMGNLPYIDGNGNEVKSKCTHGSPERIASRLYADNTLVLPLLSLSEVSTENADDRRRYGRVVISEKAWDAKKKRATRVLYVSPRPITITYEVNIWAKYKADMDMLRSSIYSLFCPDVNIRTKFSDYNKAFIVSETDIGTSEAGDAQDRVLKKSITIALQTYIPSPKFQVTNTGEITPANFKVEVSVGSIRGVNVTDGSGDPGTLPPPPDSPPYVPPVTPPGRVSLDTIYITLGDTVISVRGVNIEKDLGNIELSLTVDALSSIATTNVREDLGSVGLSLTVDALSSIAITNVRKDLGSVGLSLTVDALSSNVNTDAREDLGNIELSLTVDDLTSNVDSNLGSVGLSLTVNELSSNANNDLGSVELSLTVNELSSNANNDLGNIELSLTVDDLTSNIDLYFSLPDNMVTPSDPE